MIIVFITIAMVSEKRFFLIHHRTRNWSLNSATMLIGVQMLVELAMKVFGQHPDVREQRPQHVQFLTQQFDPLL